MYTGRGCDSFIYDEAKEQYDMIDCDVFESKSPNKETYNYGELDYGTYGYNGYDCESVGTGNSGYHNVNGC